MSTQDEFLNILRDKLENLTKQESNSLIDLINKSTASDQKFLIKLSKAILPNSVTDEIHKNVLDINSTKRLVVYVKHQNPRTIFELLKSKKSKTYWYVEVTKDFEKIWKATISANKYIDIFNLASKKDFSNKDRIFMVKALYDAGKVDEEFVDYILESKLFTASQYVALINKFGKDNNTKMLMKFFDLEAKTVHTELVKYLPKNMLPYMVTTKGKTAKKLLKKKLKA